MSKGRGKMQSLGSRVSRRRAKKQAPVAWTWKDKLTVAGIALGAIALMLGICVFVSSQSYRRAIEGRVERWRAKYDLSEAQMEELTALELEFHRHDQPFSFRSEPTKAEKDAHRQKKAKLLGVRGSHEISEETMK